MRSGEKSKGTRKGKEKVHWESMSNLSSKDNVLGICCADIHLSHTAPIARAGEPDWYEAMRRPLREIKSLCKKYGCPLLIAGDIFHKWNSPAELINFAMEELFTKGTHNGVYAIPGQHDLPYHSLDHLHKCAYRTLAQGSWSLTNLSEIGPIIADNKLYIKGFAWGRELEKCERNNPDFIYIALIHKYIWTKNAQYPNANPDEHFSAYQDILSSYDFTIWGDNHIPFSLRTKSEMQIWNCGSLMRRNSDQIDHKPIVGIITEKGIKVHYLDCSEDIIQKIDDLHLSNGQTFNLEIVMEAIDSLKDRSGDFIANIKKVIAKDTPKIQKLILDAIELGVSQS